MLFFRVLLILLLTNICSPGPACFLRVCRPMAALAAYLLQSHMNFLGSSSPQSGNAKLRQIAFFGWKTELWGTEASCLRIFSWSGTEVDVRSQAFQEQVSVFCSKMEPSAGEPAVLIPLLGTLQQHSPSHPTPILGPHRMETHLRPASFSQSLLQRVLGTKPFSSTKKRKMLFYVPG